MDTIKWTWPQYIDYQHMIFDELDYRPSEEQAVFHSSRERIRLVAGGERGGKSFSTARDAVARTTFPNNTGVYWIVGPDYAQPRKEFEYMLGDYRRLGKTVSQLSMPVGQSSPWFMRVGGVGIVQTKTAADIKKIASEALDGAIIAEAAQCSYDVFLKVRGRVAETRGWMVLSGTFESSLGWYADYFNRWQAPNPEDAKSYSLPTWSNLAVYPGGRNDPEIMALEATYPADLFLERFGAVPCKPSTLVFKEFDYTTHVFDWVRYNPALPVHLAIDPGYSPGAYAVLAIQTHDEMDGPEQAWIIDEIYVHEHTGPEVINIAKSREWWPMVRYGVMDIAGRQHHAMESQIEVWRNLARLNLKSELVPILDGISRHRTFLKDPETSKPRLYHAPHITGMLGEYGKYKRPEDRETGATQDLPIDRDNHAMKAIAYWLYDRYGPVARLPRRTTKGKRL